jgi:hypothetical protein
VGDTEYLDYVPFHTVSRFHKNVTFALGMFMFVFSLAVSRLLDVQIVKATKKINHSSSSINCKPKAGEKLLLPFLTSVIRGNWSDGFYLKVAACKIVKAGF